MLQCRSWHHAGSQAGRGPRSIPIYNLLLSCQSRDYIRNLSTIVDDFRKNRYSGPNLNLIHSAHICLAVLPRGSTAVHGWQALVVHKIPPHHPANVYSRKKSRCEGRAFAHVPGPRKEHPMEHAVYLLKGAHKAFMNAPEVQIPYPGFKIPQYPYYIVLSGPKRT